jgi:hypothetical protein
LVVVTRPEPHLIDKYGIRLRIMQEKDGSLPITTLRIPDFGEQRIVWTSGTKNEFTRTIGFSQPFKIQQETSTSVPVAEVASRFGTASADSSARPGPTIQ